MDDIWKSAIGSLIVIIIFKLITWSRDRFSLVLTNRDPRLPSVVFNTLFIIWCIAGVALHYYVIAVRQSLTWLLPVFLVWSFFMIYYLKRRRSQLRSIGIFGADKEIRKGINYRRSLSLCQNELKFLGIGAGKLTAEKEAFEKAIYKCRQGQPIKLLLSKPTHEFLIEAARRFGKPEGEYKQIVINSLRKIAELKRKCKNIEVRFYNEFQIFRLMFIDDSVCLLSYNITGEGDGSQLPQLYIVKPSQTQKVSSSLYYPLDRYFDTLWEASVPWDFEEYLNE